MKLKRLTPRGSLKYGMVSTAEVHINNLFIRFNLAIAQVYMNEGNEEYRKQDFSNAINFYTQGITVKCKDKELKAKLHSNKLGEFGRSGCWVEFLN